MLEKLRDSLTSMKFIAFVLTLIAATISVQDDTQWCLLVGACYAALCGANVANTRKALDMGVPPKEAK